MTRYDAMMKRIRSGEKILIDGATGTEIVRRGVPQLDNAWNGGGALSHPDILHEVHTEYLDVGAKILISNTFATHLHALEDAGEADQFEAYNRRGVEIAREAVEARGQEDVLVAGGISYWSWSGRLTTVDSIGDPAARQAQIMAEAGADLIMLEMMVDQDRMEVTLDAALASGLPVWVGLSCKPDRTGKMCLLNGDPLVPVIKAIERRDVPLISIMHTEVEYVSDCLDVLKNHWDGAIGVYAHSARWVDHKTVFDGTITASDYAAYSETWLAQGVQVIGGCCGLGVEHIKALRPLLHY